MKKKVLITLGCSFTQGDGCYDYSLIDTEFNGKPYHEFTEEDKSKFWQLNEPRFLEYGWPSKLQEKLGYDELYNLGFGGAAISHSIKILLDKFYYKDFSDCDVLLVHMLSFPDRISFFSNSKIKTFRIGSKLHQEYIKEIKGLGLDIHGNADDTTLEGYFYVKILKELCANKGWNFLFCSARGDEDTHMDHYRDKELISNNFMRVGSIINMSNKELLSKICGHPNEDGYLAIADTLFSYIKENHSEVKIGTATEFKKEYVRPIPFE